MKRTLLLILLTVTMLACAAEPTPSPTDTTAPFPTLRPGTHNLGPYEGQYSNNSGSNPVPTYSSTLPQRTPAPTRMPTPRTEWPRIYPADERYMHWELAELHVEYGGYGFVPVFAETPLSQDIYDVLWAIAGYCGGTGEDVFSYTYAGYLALMQRGADIDLLHFMDTYLIQAMRRLPCDDAATRAIQTHLLVEKAFDEMIGGN